MGVNLQLKAKSLPKKFQNLKITNTIDGVSHSVYFLGNNYVLKIFENLSIQNLKNELYLLELLKSLNVVKPINQIYKIENNIALIYHKNQGKSIRLARKIEIRQIGIFLYSMHRITSNHTNTNTKLYTKENLYEMILKTNNKDFLITFDMISVYLKDDGIIHGDLFLDNCTFKNKKLVSVYDFSEACVGDFVFDLAVVAISWCNTKEDIGILLESYGYKGTLENFRQYFNFAILYYSTKRFINKRPYKKLYSRLIFY